MNRFQSQHCIKFLLFIVYLKLNRTPLSNNKNCERSYYFTGEYYFLRMSNEAVIIIILEYKIAIIMYFNNSNLVTKLRAIDGKRSQSEF